MADVVRRDEGYPPDEPRGYAGKTAAALREISAKLDYIIAMLEAASLEEETEVDHAKAAGRSAWLEQHRERRLRGGA